MYLMKPSSSTKKFVAVFESFPNNYLGGFYKQLPVRTQPEELACYQQIGVAKSGSVPLYTIVKLLHSNMLHHTV